MHPATQQIMKTDLNAAQIQANDKIIKDAIMEVIAQMKLRQWCIEKAIETTAVGDPVTTAKSIFKFVTSLPEAQ